MDIDPNTSTSSLTTNIAWMVEQACWLEASAVKPGNVHVHASFDDMQWSDFVLSGSAIAPVMEQAGGQGLGRTILNAVKATQSMTPVNTNLGLILLLAPLCSVPPNEPLESGVAALLTRSSVDDTRLIYEAIRLASPAGMGRVEDADLRDEPSITPVEAMQLAADRDAIAAQYRDNFHDLIDRLAPELQRRLEAESFVDDAIIGFYLACVAEGDSHIARKHGVTVASQAAERAQVTLARWETHDNRDAALEEFDCWLRDRASHLNPGTSADLTGAALFLALRDDKLKPPYRWRNALRSDPCGF